MKELFYKDENNYYKFEEVPEDFFEQNKILADEIQRLNNIIDGLEKYLKKQMEYYKLDTDYYVEYKLTLDKLNELKGDNK